MLGGDDLEGVGDCIAGEQHGPQQRGLGVQVVGRYTPDRSMCRRSTTTTGGPERRSGGLILSPWGLFRQRGVVRNRKLRKGHVGWSRGVPSRVQIPIAW
jgi:hypothetical protein